MTTQGDTGVAPTGDNRSAGSGAAPDGAGPTVGWNEFDVRGAGAKGAGTDEVGRGSATAGPVSAELGRLLVAENVGRTRGRGAPSRSHAAPATPGALSAALRRLREILAGCRFGLATEGAAAAREEAHALGTQLEDYLRPRLDTLGGPLLAVVCGPTGAGKSTLVNSLVRAPVSQAGALRPTTRAPVLVANPVDAPWFSRPEILPHLTRTAAVPVDPAHLQVVAAPALPVGVALLDAPDIDSVVDANRDLATELMAAADLWLFVTTPSRYADALPWRHLETARERGANVALVLNRVPHRADRVVREHLDQLLAAADLSDAPVFDVAECRLDHQGLVPADDLADLHGWFERVADDIIRRTVWARQALDGAIGALPRRVAALAGELAAQHAAAIDLRDVVRDAHRTATATVDDAVRRGPLLAGESLARWHELLDGGELMRAVKYRSGGVFDQFRASLSGHDEPPGQHFADAARELLVALYTDALSDAAQRTADGWAATPAGAQLLTDVELPAVDPTPAASVDAWLDGLLDAVRNDAGQRSAARDTARTVASVRLLVLVAVVAAPSRSDADGTERAMLDTVLADPVVRRLAPRASQDLVDRLRRLVDQQRRHYDAAVNRMAEAGGLDERLRAAGRDVAAARAATTMTTDRVPLPPPVPPEPEPAPEDPAAVEKPAGPTGSPDSVVTAGNPTGTTDLFTPPDRTATPDATGADPATPEHATPEQTAPEHAAPKHAAATEPAASPAKSPADEPAPRDDATADEPAATSPDADVPAATDPDDTTGRHDAAEPSVAGEAGTPEDGPDAPSGAVEPDVEDPAKRPAGGAAAAGTDDAAEPAVEDGAEPPAGDAAAHSEDGAEPAPGDAAEDVEAGDAVGSDADAVEPDVAGGGGEDAVGSGVAGSVGASEGSAVQRTGERPAGVPEDGPAAVRGDESADRPGVAQPEPMATVEHGEERVEGERPGPGGGEPTGARGVKHGSQEAP